MLAVTYGLIDYIIEMGGNKENIFYVPNGVDLARYRLQTDRNQLRAKFGFKKDDIVLMYMGWIYAFSGIKELVTHLQRNEESLNNIKLLIVGGGDVFNEISKKRQMLLDETKIILTGQIPFSQMPEYLSTADYFIMPSYKNKIMENIAPIKLYEYMAFGKPIICTKLKGVYREFSDNAGIIYIDDPLEVYDVLNDTSIDKDKLKEKQLLFIKDYDWNNITENFLQILSNLKKDGKKKL